MTGRLCRGGSRCLVRETDRTDQGDRAHINLTANSSTKSWWHHQRESAIQTTARCWPGSTHRHWRCNPPFVPSVRVGKRAPFPTRDHHRTNWTRLNCNLCDMPGAAALPASSARLSCVMFHFTPLPPLYMPPRARGHPGESLGAQGQPQRRLFDNPRYARKEPRRVNPPSTPF